MEFTVTLRMEAKEVVEFRDEEVGLTDCVRSASGSEITWRLARGEEVCVSYGVIAPWLQWLSITISRSIATGYVTFWVVAIKMFYYCREGENSGKGLLMKLAVHMEFLKIMYFV